MPLDRLTAWIALSDDQVRLFERFLDDLYAQNRVMNLTRVPEDEAELRHLVDSLLFHDLVPHGSEVLDLGTGPGFPAWPLACARPDLRVTALDSSGKMLGFLRRHPLANLDILEARAEEYSVTGRFDVVTGRAVAPLAVQLEISARPCARGGAVIPMRTPSERPAAEAFHARELGLVLESIHERTLPELNAPRMFPVFRKVQPTPSGYPRRWAEIKRKPLG